MYDNPFEALEDFKQFMGATAPYDNLSNLYILSERSLNCSRPTILKETSLSPLWAPTAFPRNATRIVEPRTAVEMFHQHGTTGKHHNVDNIVGTLCSRHIIYVIKSSQHILDGVMLPGSS